MARGNGVATRTRIIDTAVRLFSERGTSATGMRELAEASGLTLPGLYYHFKSKEALVRAVFEERGARLRSTTDRNHGVTVRERVTHQADADFREMKDVFMRLVVLEGISGDRDASAVLAEVRSGWDARWTKVLSGAADLVSGADVAAAARCVTTALVGIYLFFVCGDKTSVKVRIEELAAVISDAISTA